MSHILMNNPDSGESAKDIATKNKDLPSKSQRDKLNEPDISSHKGNCDKAEKPYAGMQPADVGETYKDIAGTSEKKANNLTHLLTMLGAGAGSGTALKAFMPPPPEGYYDTDTDAYVPGKQTVPMRILRTLAGLGLVTGGGLLGGAAGRSIGKSLEDEDEEEKRSAAKPVQFNDAEKSYIDGFMDKCAYYQVPERTSSRWLVPLLLALTGSGLAASYKWRGGDFGDLGARFRAAGKRIPAVWRRSRAQGKGLLESGGKALGEGVELLDPATTTRPGIMSDIATNLINPGFGK